MCIRDSLNEGKPTLPLIHAMSHGTPDEAALIADALRTKSADRLSEIVALADSSGGIRETRNAAVEHCERATAALAELSSSPAKVSLEKLVEFSISRES